MRQTDARADDHDADGGKEAVAAPPAVKAFDRSGNVLPAPPSPKPSPPAIPSAMWWRANTTPASRHLKLLGNVATAGLPQLTIARYLKSNRHEGMIRSAARTYAQRSGDYKHHIRMSCGQVEGRRCGRVCAAGEYCS